VAASFGGVVVVPLSFGVVVVPLSVPVGVVDPASAEQRPETCVVVYVPSFGRYWEVPPSPPQVLKQADELFAKDTHTPVAEQSPASGAIGNPHCRGCSQSAVVAHDPPCWTVPVPVVDVDAGELLLEEQPPMAMASMTLASKVFIGAQPITRGTMSTCNRH
jgi:hypothetical protein